MNDLLGLKRAWGAYPGDGSGTVDCCLLALEVHKRLGYHDYTPEVAWILEQYTDDTLPKNFIAKWLLQNGTRLYKQEPHALALLPSHGVGAVGTVLDDGTMLFIGPGGSVIRTTVPHDFGWYFRLNK